MQWNVLHEGTSGDLVLASDFPATGRTVPGFSDLVAKLLPASSVWETAPPPAGSEEGMSAADYTGRWLADLKEIGRPVRAVLGYCVGSVFAAPIAEQLAQWQPEPPAVVVIDPERPDGALIHRHYHELIAGLSVVLTPQEVTDAQEAGRRVRESAIDLASLARALSDLFRDAGDIGFARAGLDEVRRAELVGTFRGFLHYLVVAGEIDPVPVWSTATAISSVSPQNGLNVLSPREREEIVGREVRFDLEHAQLLCDPEVVALVSELIGA
jgi:hypothetical protein